jgi:hypothetical protein
VKGERMDQGVWRNGRSGRGEEELYATGCLERAQGIRERHVCWIQAADYRHFKGHELKTCLIVKLKRIQEMSTLQIPCTQSVSQSVYLVHALLKSGINEIRWWMNARGTFGRNMERKISTLTVRGTTNPIILLIRRHDTLCARGHGFGKHW